MINLTHKLGSADAVRVFPAAMAVLDRLQNYPIEEQILGACLVFEAVCAKVGISPGEAAVYAHNLRDQNPHIAEHRALTLYVENEIKENR